MAEKIHIAHLVYSFHVESGGGGIARAAMELAQNLDSNRFEIEIIGLGNSGTQAEADWISRMNARGIRAWTAVNWDEERPYRSMYAAYRRLHKNFSRRRADIIHSHSEFSDIVAIALKAFGGAPAILRTIHYPFAVEWRSKPLRRALLTNFLYPILFNAEVSLNAETQKRLDGRFFARLLNRKSRLIYGAIDLDRLTNVQVDVPEMKASLGIPKDAYIVGCIGRLVEQKGHTYLIQAAETVIKAFPAAHFIIIGDGPLGSALQNQAAAAGLSEHIHFLGSRRDVEQLLRCMDVYAMASLWEGMPISIMESMASRVPVVTTDIPGSRTLIRNHIDGILTPPRDPAALARETIRLLASASERTQLANQAAHRIQDFSFKSAAEEYAQVYSEIAARRAVT